MYTYIHVCICKCMCMYANAYMYVYTYAYIYIHTAYRYIDTVYMCVSHIIYNYPIYPQLDVLIPNLQVWPPFLTREEQHSLGFQPPTWVFLCFLVFRQYSFIHSLPGEKILGAEIRGTWKGIFMHVLPPISMMLARNAPWTHFQTKESCKWHG